MPNLYTPPIIIACLSLLPSPSIGRVSICSPRILVKRYVHFLIIPVSPSLPPILHSPQSDPYIKIKIGKKLISDKKNYIPNSLDPLFGRMFEVPARLPMENTLTITVMDHDSISADDLIGETKIDLENRFLSHHRPRCGLSKTFAR